MHPLLLLTTALATGALLVQLVNLLRHLWRVNRSPLRSLPGPRDRPSLALGHQIAMFSSEKHDLELKWKAKYGPTFTFRGVGESLTLHTTDPRAISHILFNTEETWWRPEMNRRVLSRLLGHGVLVTEGEEHKLQRKVMNPAFGPQQIRDFNAVFLSKSAQLCDILLSKVVENPEQPTEVLWWLSKVTLDIIGRAGFGYEFDALNETGAPNALAAAFDTIFRGSALSPLRFFLLDQLPFLRWLPSRQQRDGRAAHDIMQRIGRELLAEKKAAILAEGKDPESGQRDLLTLLLKANMANDVPPEHRLTDEAVIDQVPTFLAAGHETTSTSMAWLLFELSMHQDIQDKLRAELVAVPTDEPSSDVLNALPYLDAVTREVLRLHAVVTGVNRVAVQPDVIPLSVPLVDRAGVTRTEIRVAPGDPVLIPISMLNMSTEIWGADAHAFRPERWAHDTLPSDTGRVPGIMSGLATFIGGPRACIGWRFAVLEMKALVFHLVRTFQFALAVPPESVRQGSTGLSRPMIRGEKNAQMPLILKPIQEL